MSKLNILIVEDEPIAVKDIALHLQHLGYNVAGEAASGEQALASVKQLKPDLVLMDIRLRGEMDGIDAAKQIRAEFTLPVIFLTAFADQDTIDQAKSAEPYGFIKKPFQKEELRGVIETAFYKHQMEQRLIASEERYRLIDEATVDFVYSYDNDNRFTHASRSLCKAVGLTSDQIIGKTYYELGFPEEQCREWDSLHTRVYETGDTVTAVTSTPIRHDDIRYYEVVLNPIFDSKEKIIGISGSSRDITLRRLAEVSLRKEQELTQQYLDVTSILLLSLDIEGNVTLINPKGCEVLGYPKEEIIGYNWFDKFLVDEVVDQVKQVFNQIIMGEIEVVEYFENSVLRKDGSKRILAWHNSLLFGQSGEIVGTFSSGEDITERKQAQERLESAFKEIEKLKNRLEEENYYLQHEIKLEHNYDEIIGNSPYLKKVLHNIELAAQVDSSVLVTGETGTGKELVVRAIHNFSSRKDYPLIKVNCAALSSQVIESELFGHEKGAFTGAVSRRKGRFELAHNGTIFLDEIGELSEDIQTKLLRVLQEGEFERVGGEQTMKVDARVIAATNRDLKQAVLSGRFRQDLFFRLNVFNIHVPALRERRTDIPLLVNHFVLKYGKKMGKAFELISEDTMAFLQSQNWPGNIRELENIVERAVIFGNGPILNIDQATRLSLKSDAQEMTFRSLAEMERQYIVKVLDETNWVIKGDRGAAKILDMHPNTLRSRMEKLQIRRSN